MITFRTIRAARVRVRVRLISPHMHARLGCQACNLTRVGGSCVKSERVVKRSRIQCHMPQNASISVQVSAPPSHVGPPIPPCDVCVAP